MRSVRSGSFTIFPEGSHRPVRFSAIHPARILALSFLGLICLGTFLLRLPISSQTGIPIAWVDAFFTATSAVCTIGLSVVHTAQTFSMFGQTMILILIQIGGLGIMAFSTLVGLLLGRRISLKERLTIQQSLNQISPAGMVRLVRSILVLTLLIEGIGALILTWAWQARYGWPDAIWYGIFHSVAAFNNSGFDLFRAGLHADVVHISVNICISLLVIVGGLGFGVLVELFHWRAHRQLSLHAKVVLWVSGFLLLIGTLFILGGEWHNPQTLGSLSYPERVMAAFFHSAMSRSAGFSTVSIGAMTQGTLLFIALLMFIGASPGSTAGGIKTTTVAVILGSMWASFKGKNDVEIFNRRISEWLVRRAMVVAASSMILVTLALLAMSWLEPGHSFLSLFFEIVSAYGTTGMSTGITPELGSVGKILLCFLMFAGRVGPLTVGAAIAVHREGVHPPIRLPEEKISIG